MRLLWIAGGLAVVVALPFLLWGDDFTRWFTGEAVIARIRAWGPWGWLAVISLLVSDLVLPIPATAVITAAGYVYGAVVGAVLGAAGSFIAGMTGYSLCRLFGRGVAVRLAGEQEMERNEKFFAQSGPWLVAVSRWFPVLPEVVSCLAGLTRMPVRTFAVSLLCGTLPMSAAYACIGAAGQERPWLAVTISVLLPPVLWLLARRWITPRA